MTPSRSRRGSSPLEGRSPGDRRRPAVDAGEVVGEGRVRERGRCLGLDTGATRVFDAEGIAQHGHDVGEHGRRPIAGPATEPFQADLRPVLAAGAGPGRFRVGHDHHAARPDVLEPVRDQAIDEVHRRVVQWRRPDMRLASDRGEQDEGLGQAAIERIGLDGPAQRLQAVPERFGVGRIVEQDRVPEIAQLATRHGVDAGLVREQSAHRRRVDGVDESTAGCAMRAHARTIPATKPFVPGTTYCCTTPLPKEKPCHAAPSPPSVCPRS